MVKYLREWNIPTKKKTITDYSIQCNSFRRIYVISPGIDTPSREPRPTAATYGLIMEYHPGTWQQSEYFCLASGAQPITDHHHTCHAGGCCRQQKVLQCLPPKPHVPSVLKKKQDASGKSANPDLDANRVAQCWAVNTGEGPVHSWGLRPSSRCLLGVIVGALVVLFPFGSSS